MKKIKWLLLVVGLLGGLWLLSPFMLDFAGRVLIVQDKLRPADLIVVLGGDGNGERVATGVRLYKQGLAPKILMSGGPLAWQLTYAEWMKKQALASGVPAAALLLQAKSLSTAEDAKYSRKVIEPLKIKTIILITSPQHTRRAARVFRKIFPAPDYEIMVYPAQPSAFKVDRWWTRYEDRALVVWEYFSSVLYF